MKIVIIDFELPDYICTDFLDGNQFKEWLSQLNDEIYFADVRDKTWNKFRTKNSKRVELDLDGLMKLINEATYLIRIKRNKAELCTYYPEEDDP